MEKGSKIDEAGHNGPANAPDSEGDDERARLIGEILRDYVSGLGPDRAMTPDCVCEIVPAAGEDIQRRGRSGATQSMGLIGGARHANTAVWTTQRSWLSGRWRGRLLKPNTSAPTSMSICRLSRRRARQGRCRPEARRIRPARRTAGAHRSRWRVAPRRVTPAAWVRLPIQSVARTPTATARTEPSLSSPFQWSAQCQRRGSDAQPHIWRWRLGSCRSVRPNPIG